MNTVNNIIDDKINKLLNKSVKKVKTNLVLSGGGIKGIAHLGALKALEDNNILQNITTFVGTSVGGWAATVLVMGYTVDELYKFSELFDFSRATGGDMNPAIIFTRFGIDDGKKLSIIMKKIMEAKNFDANITFKDLYKKTKKKLILVTSCLNDKKTHYLSHITHPNLPVIVGLRMTTSIPIWFMPVEYEDMLYVDGGCTDNYPISLFNDNLESTIGIFLSDHTNSTNHIKNAEDFLSSLVRTLIEGVKHNSYRGYEKYTINIISPEFKAAEFNISNKMKKQLYNIGYATAISFLKLHKI